MSGQESMLHRSWCDNAWLHNLNNLNSSNVLHYFSERTNPFYDHRCNNELIKMQRLDPEKILDMEGMEYILLHAQEPILFVIRQQFRHSRTQVAPLAEFYIISGVIYQAPDLNTIINSRILSSVYNLGSAFEEAQSYSRYHPTKGYTWEFKDGEKDKKQSKSSFEEKSQDKVGSLFQRSRVDLLLQEFQSKFGAKRTAQNALEKPEELQIKGENKLEIKMEKPDPNQPKQTSTNIPDKRFKIN